MKIPKEIIVSTRVADNTVGTSLAVKGGDDLGVAHTLMIAVAQTVNSMHMTHEKAKELFSKYLEITGGL